MSTIKPVAFMDPNQAHVKDAFSWVQEDGMVPVVALTEDVRVVKVDDIKFALRYYNDTGSVQTLIDELNIILDNK